MLILRSVARQLKFLLTGKRDVVNSLAEIARQLERGALTPAAVEHALEIHGGVLEEHATRLVELTQTCEFLLDHLARLEFLIEESGGLLASHDRSET